MSKLLLNIPDLLLADVNKITKNKSDFIRQAIKEKLDRETMSLLIEGYSKEKNLDEWDTTINDGI